MIVQPVLDDADVVRREVPQRIDIRTDAAQIQPLAIDVTNFPQLAGVDQLLHVTHGRVINEGVAGHHDEAALIGPAGKVIDFEALELYVGDRTLQLTLMEANLLRYLIRHEGKAVSRKAMLEEVWGVREDTDTRAIDNFIVRLRRYIEDDPTHPRHLLTVRGVGYRFVGEVPDLPGETKPAT